MVALRSLRSIQVTAVSDGETASLDEPAAALLRAHPHRFCIRAGGIMEDPVEEEVCLVLGSSSADDRRQWIAGLEALMQR
jgi:hypothetical protein